jgi:hypothetical protein
MWCKIVSREEHSGTLSRTAANIAQRCVLLAQLCTIVWIQGGTIVFLMQGISRVRANLLRLLSALSINAQRRRCLESARRDEVLLRTCHSQLGQIILSWGRYNTGQGNLQQAVQSTPASAH